MNTAKHTILVFACMISYINAANAYEIQTHAKLSEAAFDQSVLSKDTQPLQKLGLKSSDKFLNSQDPEPRTIKELISDGARFEDDGLRPRNHFYDPLTGLGLQGVSIPFFTIYASPDWALANTRTISDQQFSQCRCWKRYRADTNPGCMCSCRKERYLKVGLRPTRTTRDTSLPATE